MMWSLRVLCMQWNVVAFGAMFEQWSTNESASPVPQGNGVSGIMGRVACNSDASRDFPRQSADVRTQQDLKRRLSAFVMMLAP